MGDAVTTFIERFRSLGLDGGPCSAAEVEGLEDHLRVTLPTAYKAYLRIAGRHAPAAWVGSDCTVDKLPDLQEWGPELLRESGQPPLPPQAFVFAMHQGYQFYYFLADGCSDDPPVFYYLEGEPAVVPRFERLSDLIAIVANDRRDA